jgi:hypothetical protein
VAKNGDLVALAPGFDAQHAEAVLFVVERDALDKAGQDLGRLTCCSLHHCRIGDFRAST